MDKFLVRNISESALAFRGYNVTNLGKTPELLKVRAYEPLLTEELSRFSRICEEITNAPCNLVDIVRERSELDLKRYAQAVALVVAVETAQLRLLSEVHHVDVSRVRLSFGYSIGEMVAVCAGGIFAAADLVKVPLEMAADCAELALSARMGILFSRGPAIAELHVQQLCSAVTSENRGTIGISAVLSPNTYLLIGQHETLKRFKQVMGELLPRPVHLRINSHRWPPMHTPIVRQRNVPDRSSVMLEHIVGGTAPACPPVFSLATGDRGYERRPAREVLRTWIDHPQRLWDAVCDTLSEDIGDVIHIGPEPNVIPATFSRLSENIREQTNQRSLESYRMRAISGLARRPWLASLLPSRASLLRAPYVRHILLEDWLLQNAPE